MTFFSNICVFITITIAEHASHQQQKEKYDNEISHFSRGGTKGYYHNSVFATHFHSLAVYYISTFHAFFAFYRDKNIISAQNSIAFTKNIFSD